MNNEAALVIGEDAFRAGFRAGVKAAKEVGAVPAFSRAEEYAWALYDPPEDIKALTDDQP